MTNKKPFTELAQMTPVEIAEYKMQWKPGHQVTVHSDLDIQCKDFCRKNFNRWEWSMDKYTHVYAHTFYFEFEEFAYMFKMKFKEWVDKGID